jgi:WD40 repeat protein
MAVAVPLLDTGGDDVRPAGRMNRSGIIAHPDQSPPRDLIAVGDTVVAGFSTTKMVTQPNKDRVITRTYSLLDQKTGKYVKDSRWSFVDIAPGGRTAAVLERQLPARRVGLLDLMTGKVDRWIPVPQGVAGVDFSPDGKKLVATTYTKDPDRLYWSHRQEMHHDNGTWEEPLPVPSRTGFTLIDVASGKSDWHKAPYRKDAYGNSLNSRENFTFNHDGRLLYEFISKEPYRVYRDLWGRTVPTPAAETKLANEEIGFSPDGKLVGYPSGVREVATRKPVRKVPDADHIDPLAWAGSKRFIAWRIDEGQEGNPMRLVLITLGNDKIVPLSDFMTQDYYDPGHWEPLFSGR